MTDRLYIHTRLLELAMLEDGWLDGDGIAIDRGSLRTAQMVLASAAELDAPVPRLYPTPDGLVQAEWVIGDWAVDARFGGSGFDIAATNAVTHESRHRGFETPDRLAHELVVFLRRLR